MKMQVLFLAAALVLVESAPKHDGMDLEAFRGACAYVVNNITDPNIGQYLPQCDDHGNFRLLQCWRSIGVCWCVNPYTGEEIPRTKTYKGQEPANCELWPEGEEHHEKPLCPEHWTQFDDHCYIFIDSPKCWAEAESYCQFEEGHLASITCAKTNHFIQALTKGNTHNFPESWVGGTNAVAACLWMWSDGSPFKYEDWSNEKIKTRESSCLTINSGCNTNKLQWGAANCTELLPFVCVKDINCKKKPY